MKRMIEMLGLAVLFMLATSFVQAQRVVIEDDLYKTTSTKRFTSTAGGTLSGVTYVLSDSVTTIAVTKVFTIAGIKVNLVPDSIVWSWEAKGYTTADSVAIYMTVLQKFSNGTNSTRIPVDSALAFEHDSKTLTQTWYEGADNLTAVLKTTNVAGVASKNQYKANGGSTFILKQRRFFTLK